MTIGSRLGAGERPAGRGSAPPDPPEPGASGAAQLDGARQGRGLRPGDRIEIALRRGSALVDGPTEWAPAIVDWIGRVACSWRTAPPVGSVPTGHSDYADEGTYWRRADRPPARELFVLVVGGPHGFEAHGPFTADAAVAELRRHGSGTIAKFNAVEGFEP